ncbi:MAG: HEAT repeat domain-containing protein [Gracilibacteraceae bacterium]|jgi:epoxyqueuosine reductase|nr:HEAT repeat domain-containing protein [Gracilibacteraceae bacterium]
MSLTEEIKEFALDIGYCKAGVTTADDFTDYIEDVKSRGVDYDFYQAHLRKPLESARPRLGLPDARSIVVMALDYGRIAFPPSLLGKIGRIYQARCYNTPPHRLNGARLQLMRDFLRQNGCELTADSFFLPARPVAVRAGIAGVSANNFAFVEGAGSFVVISWVIVDKELDYDEPAAFAPCPEGCDACRKACPTQALYAPYRLNPRRCLAFLAWMTQEGRPMTDPVIAPELRELMGAHIHGCDLCQEACPRNHARLRAAWPEDPFLTELAGDFSLVKLLQAEDEFMRRRVTPIMYNYIQEKKYFQRNAAIALGNEGDPESVPALRGALRDPEGMVRGYAAWALGKIGGAGARQALEDALRGERDPFARQEMEASLRQS